MAELNIKVKVAPTPKIHPNAQALEPIEDFESMHVIGQTSLFQAKTLKINSDTAVVLIVDGEDVSRKEIILILT